MREAPSRVVIAELTRRGASVRAYDPVAMTEARARARRHCARAAASPPAQADALEGADALVIVTEWKEFRSPDFDAHHARR